MTGSAWRITKNVLIVPATLFLALCGHAQGVPDFSGVYLRENTGPLPLVSGTRILEVRQTADALDVNEFENGAAAHVRYDLTGRKATQKWPSGMSSRNRAHFKKQRLIIESSLTYPRQTVCWGNEAVSWPLGYEVHTKQEWELSPDSKRLLIIEERDDSSRVGV